MNNLNINKHKAIQCDMHDDAIGARDFFWHRRYGRMQIDPVLCGLLEP